MLQWGIVTIYGRSLLSNKLVDPKHVWDCRYSSHQSTIFTGMHERNAWLVHEGVEGEPKGPQLRRGIECCSTNTLAGWQCRR